MLGMLVTSGWVGSVKRDRHISTLELNLHVVSPPPPGSCFHYHLRSITPVCSLLRATHAAWAQSDVSVTTQHTDAALNFVSPQNQPVQRALGAP